MEEAARRSRPPMSIQALLFDRDAGWTASKAKEWAKSHGYKYGKVHVTDQYVRIRQFDPKGLKVKRTKTLGRGIRAVVAREEDMGAAKEEVRRGRSRRAAKPAFGSPEWRAMYPRRSKKSKARRTREAPVATEARRRRRTREAPVTTEARRRTRRTREAPVTEARPRRRRARAPAGYVMEEARPRRRRSRRTREEAWRGDKSGHRKAAKKGWATRRKAAKRGRKAREEMMEARPRRRRSYRYSEEARRRRAREEEMMEARRPRRRRYRAGEARRGSSGMGEQIGKLAIRIGSAGVGFILADMFDRYLATYNPEKEAPEHKFTSTGSGALANTLNVASPPSAVRIVAALGSTVLPAIASVYVKNPFLRGSLEGAAIGAGAKALSLFFSNVLMPMLKPKEQDDKTLQKSVVARLYPAEVAASINLSQKPVQMAVSSAGSGALSGAPADVGPFAVGGSSPYADTAEALRKQAGMADQTGVDAPWRYEMRHPHVEQWRYAHPYYQPGGAASFNLWSRRWAQAGYQPAYQIQSPPHRHHHHHCMFRAKAMFPTYTDAQLHAWCHARPHHLYPYLYETPVAAPATTPAPTTTFGFSQGPEAPPPPPPPPPPAAAPEAAAPPPPPPPAAAAPPPPPPAAPAFVPAPPPPAPMPPAAMEPPPGPPVTEPGPPAYVPGPGSVVGPGPKPLNKECACLGDNNQFLGFIGDAEEKDTLFNSSSNGK